MGCLRVGLLDYIELDRLDLDPMVYEILDSLVYLLRLPVELKGDKADLIGDRGLTDIGHDLEEPADMVKERLLDLFLRIGEIDPFLQNAPPAIAGIIESSSFSLSSVSRFFLNLMSSSFR